MKQKIGEVAEGYVNVNKRDANLHIVIPLSKDVEDPINGDRAHL